MCMIGIFLHGMVSYSLTWNGFLHEYGFLHEMELLTPLAGIYIHPHMVLCIYTLSRDLHTPSHGTVHLHPRMGFSFTTIHGSLYYMETEKIWEDC